MFLESIEKCIGFLHRGQPVFALPERRTGRINDRRARTSPVKIEAMLLRNNTVFFGYGQDHRGAGWHHKRAVVHGTGEFRVRAVGAIAHWGVRRGAQLQHLVATALVEARFNGDLILLGDRYAGVVLALRIHTEE